MTLMESKSQSSEDTTELLISADSHVAITHDQVKENLATKFHSWIYYKR